MGYNLQKIPLTSSPNQSTTVALSVGGVSLRLELRLIYNWVAEYWVMTITDSATNTVLLDSLPLITGEYPAADLLSQYEYLGLGSVIVVKSSASQLDFPDDTTLGDIFVLIWSDAI